MSSSARRRAARCRRAASACRERVEGDGTGAVRDARARRCWPKPVTTDGSTTRGLLSDYSPRSVSACRTMTVARVSSAPCPTIQKRCQSPRGDMRVVPVLLWAATSAAAMRGAVPGGGGSLHASRVSLSHVRASPLLASPDRSLEAIAANMSRTQRLMKEMPGLPAKLLSLSVLASVLGAGSTVVPEVFGWRIWTAGMSGFGGVGAALARKVLRAVAAAHPQPIPTRDACALTRAAGATLHPVAASRSGGADVVWPTGGCCRRARRAAARRGCHKRDAGAGARAWRTLRAAARAGAACAARVRIRTPTRASARRDHPWPNARSLARARHAAALCAG